MKAAAFDYVRADNLEHALGILDEAGSEARHPRPRLTGSASWTQKCPINSRAVGQHL